MKLRSEYKSRKYLIRLLLSVTLLIVVLLSALSASLYFHTERTVLNIQQSANEKMLAQTVYNLDSMNEILKTTAISSYYDTAISEFMYADLSDTYILYQHLGVLEKLMKSAPFLHSIVIFNERNQCYYSYSPSAIQACQPEGENSVTARYIAKQSPVPKLRLLPVSSGNELDVRKPIDFFSYFMFNDRPTEAKQKGMLILNVQPEWLFSQLSGINQLQNYGDSRLLLVNSAGDLYDPSQRSWSAGGDLYSSVKREMDEYGKNADLFVHGSGHSKEIVSYMKSEKYDWTVVSLQPYEQVFHDILQMRSISFYIIALFLLLSLAASAILTFNLYHPVEALLSKVRAGMTATPPAESEVARKDEWSYISNAFQHTLNQVQQLSQSQVDQNTILRTYYLKKIVLESASTAPEEIEDIIRQYELNIDLRQPFLLVGLFTDAFKQTAESTASAAAAPLLKPDPSLNPIIVCELINGLFSEQYTYELMDMGTGCVVAVISHSGTDQGWQELLLQRIRLIQSRADSEHQLCLTAAISRIGEQAQDMSVLYAQVHDLANYRMIYGRMAVIVPELVESNLRSGQFLSSPELEKKLSGGIKSGNQELVMAGLQEWFRSLHPLKYEQMLFGMFHLLATVHRIVEEINANRLRPIALDTRELYGQLAHIETLQEAEQLFQHTLSDILTKLVEPSGDKTNQLVADTIHEIIHTHYGNPDLCLPEIASMVRLSSAHISKLFKQKHGAGIPDYITEVRLEHALVLLRQHDYSVNQIMEKVGFTNQSYFFRLFKKKYGTTPKEYRLKQVL
ncbi:MAG: AraC family transcriptional regulator [Paenibacillus sp.]|nr:AraC family transcriptional regulator [Paenibacillus sp.]